MLLLKSQEYVGAASSVRVLRRQPQVDYPEHGHDFSELVLVCSGSGIHVINDQQRVILPSSINCITERDYHLYDHTHDVNLLNICYEKERLNINPCCVEIIKRLESDLSRVLVTQQAFSMILCTAQQLEEEQNKPQKNSQVMCSLLFEQLLIQIERLNVNHDAHSPVMQAVVYLCDHYCDNSLSIAALCDQFAITQKALNHKLMQLSGLSTNKFVNLLRIKHAQRLLRQGKSITQVAFDVGYNDSNYFSTKYKFLTGHKPSQMFKTGEPLSGDLTPMV